MTTISDYREAIANVDAALKPADYDIAKGRHLMAHSRFPEACRAIAVWAAAREGVTKQFLVDNLDKLLELQAKSQGIDIETIDPYRSAESLWAMHPSHAEILAESLQDGLSATGRWRPVLKTDVGLAYHSQH